MPEKLIKNCVYDFAVALLSELTGFGFCSITPFPSVNVQQLLELSDPEMHGLDNSIQRWLHNDDSIALTVKRFGDTLVVFDVNVREPSDEEYFYSICMTLVHQPTARLLAKFQRQVFDPLYPTLRRGMISSHFKTVKKDLPKFTNSYLSQATWEEHGPAIVDYYVRGITTDILPEIRLDWTAKDLVLRRFRSLAVIEDPTLPPVKSAFARRPLGLEHAELAWMNDPVLSSSEIILCALGGYHDFADKHLATVLRWQVRREEMVPDKADRKRPGLNGPGDIEYIDDYFIAELRKLKSDQSQFE